MKKFFEVALKSDDVYIVGHVIGDCTGEEYDGCKWSLDGVFESIYDAKKLMRENQFVCRYPRDVMLPNEIQDPLQSWWMENGELIKSERFLEQE